MKSALLIKLEEIKDDLENIKWDIESLSGDVEDKDSYAALDSVFEQITELKRAKAVVTADKVIFDRLDFENFLRDIKGIIDRALEGVGS